MKLSERLIAIDRALTDAEIEHAFGGAIALAYWTLDPRGTSDIDVNVFVSPARCEETLAVLPPGIVRSDRDVAAIRANGQARLWWESTPVDLFFDYEELHAGAARNRRIVPFEGTEIPVLGPVELATFKAMFDRTKDWADIEAMLVAGTLDVDALRGHLVRLAGPADERLSRLDDSIRRADASREG